MENERMKIFDEERNEIGVSTREEVHKKGYWHETFQCWLLSREEVADYIYIQLRSAAKKDFPNLFDITAAGHLLADETVQDGIREVKEELGLDVSFHELVPLGTIKNSFRKMDFIDNEFCHVFLYRCQNPMNQFHLQKEEVSGMVKADFQAFSELWAGDRTELKVEGFQINEDGEKDTINRNIGKNDFVPHEDCYYKRIVKGIRKEMI